MSNNTCDHSLVEFQVQHNGFQSSSSKRIGVSKSTSSYQNITNIQRNNRASYSVPQLSSSGANVEFSQGSVHGNASYRQQNWNKSAGNYGMSSETNLNMQKNEAQVSQAPIATTMKFCSKCGEFL